MVGLRHRRLSLAELDVELPSCEAQIGLGFAQMEVGRCEVGCAVTIVDLDCELRLAARDKRELRGFVQEPRWLTELGEGDGRLAQRLDDGVRSPHSCRSPSRRWRGRPAARSCRPSLRSDPPTRALAHPIRWSQVA